MIRANCFWLKFDTPIHLAQSSLTNLSIAFHVTSIGTSASSNLVISQSSSVFWSRRKKPQRKHTFSNEKITHRILTLDASGECMRKASTYSSCNARKLFINASFTLSGWWNVVHNWENTLKLFIFLWAHCNYGLFSSYLGNNEHIFSSNCTVHDFISNSGSNLAFCSIKHSRVDQSISVVDRQFDDFLRIS